MTATLAVEAAGLPTSFAGDEAHTCFHCGLSLPMSVDYRVVIDGAPRAMCCAGCSAVAETIVASGLADYYRSRESLPRPVEIPAADLAALMACEPSAAKRHQGDERPQSACETSFALEGIRCAACAWLIERRLMQLPGVAEAAINYATHRMWVRWNAAETSPSAIVQAVTQLGYGARPFDPARHASAALAARRSALKRLAIAALGMMQVMMFSVPGYLAADGDIAPDLTQLMRWASLIITVPVLIYSGAEFFVASWRGLGHRQLTMDTPVALGLVTAFAASAWATIAGHGDVYFDSVTMFVFLLLTARFLEREIRFRAGDAVDRIVTVLPATTLRLTAYPADRTTARVAVADIAAGDCLAITPGDRIPVDGIVMEGTSETDDSLISGESTPVAKAADDAVIAGTVNLASPLIVRATRVGADSTVAHIARLMDRALTEKPAIARLADRAAGWFVAALLTVTLVVVAVWWRVAPDRAVAVAIALLVITCPCAIGLAAPAALTAGAYRLARRGLFLTRGHAVETLAGVTDVVFDKTGTLTYGRPRLVRMELLGRESESRAAALAAALEAFSEHPLGKALAAASREPLAVSNIVNRPGAGIAGVVDGQPYRIGSIEFVSAVAGSCPKLSVDVPTTTVALGSDSGWIAIFHFADTPRPEARSAVEQIRANGIRVHLLSGDSPDLVATMGTEIGIDRVRGGVSPAEKLQYIRALQREGAVVAMVGDGVNDAPGLGGAQVSIAMGRGTDVAHAAADMVLLSGNLEAIPEALRVARATHHVMLQNLGWAVTYNFFAIPLAVFGMVTPLTAAIGMSASSLIVVLNALRLACDRWPALPRRRPERAFAAA